MQLTETPWYKEWTAVAEGPVHHFWAQFADREWNKTTQVQRSDNRYNNPGGVFEYDYFPPSNFMFAIDRY